MMKVLLGIICASSMILQAQDSITLPEHIINQQMVHIEFDREGNLYLASRNPQQRYPITYDHSTRTARLTPALKTDAKKLEEHVTTLLNKSDTADLLASKTRTVAQAAALVKLYPGIAQELTFDVAEAEPEAVFIFAQALERKAATIKIKKNNDPVILALSKKISALETRISMLDPTDPARYWLNRAATIFSGVADNFISRPLLEETFFKIRDPAELYDFLKTYSFYFAAHPDFINMRNPTTKDTLLGDLFTSYKKRSVGLFEFSTMAHILMAAGIDPTTIPEELKQYCRVGSCIELAKELKSYASWYTAKPGLLKSISNFLSSLPQPWKPKGYTKTTVIEDPAGFTITLYSRVGLSNGTQVAIRRVVDTALARAEKTSIPQIMALAIEYATLSDLYPTITVPEISISKNGTAVALKDIIYKLVVEAAQSPTFAQEYVNNRDLKDPLVNIAFGKKYALLHTELYRALTTTGKDRQQHLATAAQLLVAAKELAHQEQESRAFPLPLSVTNALATLELLVHALTSKG